MPHHWTIQYHLQLKQILHVQLLHFHGQVFKTEHTVVEVRFCLSSPPIFMAYVQPTHFHGLCPVHPFPWLMSSPPISMAISYVQPTHFRGHFLYPPISVAHQFLWPFLMSTPPISMAISYIQSTHFHGNFLYPATHFHSLFLCPAHSFPCLVSSAPIFHGHFLCPAYLFP